MDKKRCTRCGKIYPSSYRTCPYCSGQGNGRRTRPSSAPEQVIAFVQQNKDRLFVITTAVFLLIALLGIVLTRCSSETPPPEKDPNPTEQEADDTQQPETPPEVMEISSTALSLHVGESAQLTVTGTADSIIWTTSDDTVASVSDGIVNANAAGTATISAACGLQKVACTVTVTVKEPDVEVYLNRTDFTLRANDPPFQMQVKVKETRANYQGTVVWSIEDTSVATISETGLVERVGRGNTTITATMGGKVLKCIVRVS